MDNVLLLRAEDMMLLPLLCLLSAGHGPTSAQEIMPPAVPEGEDAVLPCTLHPEQNINIFHWKKDNGEKEKKEVFFYENGNYYSHGLNEQDQDVQFRGRVEFFKDELKHGNASIKIKNARLEDNGTYTCVLFDLQKKQHDFKTRLNVGAARRPYINIHDKITWRLLECEVQGVPEPEVEWRNSAGVLLKKYAPNNQSATFHVKLTLNVSRSDNYTCVATQPTIYHQINRTMEACFPENSTSMTVVVVSILAASLVVVFCCVFVICYNCKIVSRHHHVPVS